MFQQPPFLKSAWGSGKARSSSGHSADRRLQRPPRRPRRFVPNSPARELVRCQAPSPTGSPARTGSQELRRRRRPCSGCPRPFRPHDLDPQILANVGSRCGNNGPSPVSSFPSLQRPNVWSNLHPSDRHDLKRVSDGAPFRSPSSRHLDAEVPRAPALSRRRQRTSRRIAVLGDLEADHAGPRHPTSSSADESLGWSGPRRELRGPTQLHQIRKVPRTPAEPRSSGARLEPRTDVPGSSSWVDEPGLFREAALNAPASRTTPLRCNHRASDSAAERIRRWPTPPPVGNHAPILHRGQPPPAFAESPGSSPRRVASKSAGPRRTPRCRFRPAPPSPPYWAHRPCVGRRLGIVGGVEFRPRIPMPRGHV